MMSLNTRKILPIDIMFARIIHKKHRDLPSEFIEKRIDDKKSQKFLEFFDCPKNWTSTAIYFKYDVLC